MREHGNRGVMALFTVEEICEVLSAKAPAGVTPHGPETADSAAW